MNNLNWCFGSKEEDRTLNSKPLSVKKLTKPEPIISLIIYYALKTLPYILNVLHS